MSMISSFVEDLRMLERSAGKNEFRGYENIFKTSADTIEALSAKLAADNMERSERHYGGGWIPCEDRMPEDSFGCLVTIIDSDSATLEDFENVLPYHVGYDGEGWNDADGERIPFEVIAWMPLPDPYNPDGE